MPDHQPTILLGFDFGMKHIGVAVGQTITQSAQALTTLRAVDGVPKWQDIQDIIDTWQANGIVVGIPYNMDDSEQPMTLAAKKFARKLHGRFHLPVFLMDERLSTFSAKLEITGAGHVGGKPKNVDSVAAKIILESWLQQH